MPDNEVDLIGIVAAGSHADPLDGAQRMRGEPAILMVLAIREQARDRCVGHRQDDVAQARLAREPLRTMRPTDLSRLTMTG